MATRKSKKPQTIWQEKYRIRDRRSLRHTTMTDVEVEQLLATQNLRAAVDGVCTRSMTDAEWTEFQEQLRQAKPVDESNSAEE